MYRILKKEVLNQNVELMVIEAPFVARRCQPGQFIILRVRPGGERIPLTIADYDRQAQSVTIIYQVVGRTTIELSKLSVGECLLDFAGPLGQPVAMENYQRILGVAGGVGAAPLYPQLKEWSRRGADIDLIIGGRTAEHLLLVEKFKTFCHRIYFATNDGSRGHQGFVTDVLKTLFEQGNEYDHVITIGPLIMMKAVVEVTKEREIPTSVSLNPIMIDGTGMCGGCRVRVHDEIKFACVDGPDFDGFAVSFDELMRRQAFFKEEEHQCRLTAMEVEVFNDK